MAASGTLRHVYRGKPESEGQAVKTALLNQLGNRVCTAMSVPSILPFDHFIAGDVNAIGDSAERGWELFNTKARCHLCHALTDNQRDATVFTDNDFHNIGIGILRHHVAPLAQRAQRELAQGNLPAVDAAAISSDLSV